MSRRQRRSRRASAACRLSPLACWLTGICLISIMASYPARLLAMPPATSSSKTASPLDEQDRHQHFKDRVLAMCIAEAYRHEALPAEDAGRSVTILRQTIQHGEADEEREIFLLIDEYLQRDYFDPITAWQVHGLRFDLMKCLDLYHSEALEHVTQAQVDPPGLMASQPERR